MNLTKGECIQIRQLLSFPQWATAERMAQMLIDQIKEQPTLDDTQWKTLQNILIKEGKIQGIREFTSEMYKTAQNT